MELFNDKAETTPETGATAEQIAEAESTVRDKINNGYQMNYGSLMSKFMAVPGELEKVASMSNLTLTCGCGRDDCEAGEPKAYSVVRLAVAAMTALNGALDDDDKMLENVRNLEDQLIEMLGLTDEDRPTVQMMIYFAMRNNRFESVYLKSL